MRGRHEPVDRGDRRHRAGARLAAASRGDRAGALEAAPRRDRAVRRRRGCLDGVPADRRPAHPARSSATRRSRASVPCPCARPTSGSPRPCALELGVQLELATVRQALAALPRLGDGLPLGELLPSRRTSRPISRRRWPPSRTGWCSRSPSTRRSRTTTTSPTALDTAARPGRQGRDRRRRCRLREPAPHAADRPRHREGRHQPHARHRQRPRTRALATALISFAEEMDITIVAEGIETQAELDTLLELGVRYGQGFFLAEPALPDLSRSDDRRGDRSPTRSPWRPSCTASSRWPRRRPRRSAGSRASAVDRDPDRDRDHREPLELAATVRDLDVAARAVVLVVELGRTLVEALRRSPAATTAAIDGATTTTKSSPPTCPTNASPAVDLAGDVLDRAVRSPGSPGRPA